MVFISLAYTTMGIDRASREYHLLVNSQFRLCTSLAPRPMTVVFGLGMILYVRMHTKLENGVLRNGQQAQSVVNRAATIYHMSLCHDIK